MKIETKFNIGDLARHKFSRNPSNNYTGGEQMMVAEALEILEVNALACYAEVQIVYTCRPLFRIFKREYIDGKQEYKLSDIAHGLDQIDKRGLLKYREDELKPCDPEIEKQIRNI